MRNLIDFVTESNRIEGILRPPTDAEIEAHETFLASPRIYVEDLQKFVAVIAPGHVIRDRRGMDVQVGDYVAPRGGPTIVGDLDDLLCGMRKVGVYETHLAYELLHPFTDGNGRSGRALWLWQMREAPLGFLHHFYYQTLRSLS